MQRVPLFAGSALVAVMLAACGGGGGGGPTTPAVTSTTSAPAATPTPTAAPTNPPSMPTQATIGTQSVWVGQNGHTLYTFSIDTSDTSNCAASNGCTAVWPPYTAPAGTTAPAGSQFAVFMRSDGTLQWAVNGQPLYEYSGDTASGTTNGNGIVGFGGTWTDAVVSGAPGPTATPYNPYVRIH